MPLISPAATSSTSMLRQRGFTLLEIMVVLVVIGLLLSMVNLASSNRAVSSETEQLARKLQAAFGQYQEESVYQNIDLGVAFLPDEMWLLAYKDVNSQEFGSNLSIEERTLLEKNPWQPYSTRLEPVFSIPEEIRFVLVIDDQEVDLVELLDDEAGPSPAVMFLSSDEYSPFDLYLTHDADEGFVIKLQGDGFNPVRLDLEVTDE